MYRGNVDKVMADAGKIACKLRNTKCTLTKLTAEYHCGYDTMMKAIHSQIPQDEWLQIRNAKLAQGGVKTRFYPGQKNLYRPPKGIHLSPATEFKKGHLPANHKELGTITIHKSERDRPYRMIAVAGPTPNRHKWIPYAQYVWEKIHGPLPKGCLVVHTDGDSMNDNPENLEATDRKGNLNLMKKNRPGWKKKAIESRKKTCRIRRMKKARVLLKAQKEAEKLQKQQARLQQATILETAQEKAAEAEKTLLYGHQFVRWDCYGCSAEYYQEQMPEQCIKCGSYCFERIVYRKKLAS
ncbi:MAG: HNH endonuclease [Sedimentisphaerales bacterium]